ncbi:MAG: PIN domain-containing protein [Micromonosporaceae bacterium]|nr:PIN domain-containing protein [Micromonosporaceae bacterium]
MDGRTFIDTNVFIYAEDEDQVDKRPVARELIQQLAREERGVVSTQVLMEYVAAARRRLRLSLAQCRQSVLLMCRFEVVLIRPEQVLGALDLAGTYSLSHWDSLILKSAAASGCRVLITEDLQHGQTIEGVTVHNPFA